MAGDAGLGRPARGGASPWTTALPRKLRTCP